MSDHRLGRQASYSYHTKILTYFVTVSACCILLTCILLGSFFFYRLNTLTNNYNDLLLRNSRIELQKTFEQIGSSSIQLCINKTVNRFLSAVGPVNYDDMTSVQSLVSDMSAANDYTDSIYVVDPGHNRVISSFGVYSFDSFSDREWLAQVEGRDEPLAWLGAREIVKDRLTGVPSRVATLVVQMPMYRREREGYLVYNIRESFLRQRLSHAQQNEGENGFVLLVDGGDALVSCSADTQQEGFPELYRSIMREVANGGVGRIVSVGGTWAVLSVAGTTVNDWRFVTYTPIGHAARETFTTMSCIAGFALVVLLASFAFARHFGRKIYEPVDQLLRFTSVLRESAEPTRFLEFQRIHENVAGLLQEKDSLAEQLRDLIPSLRDKLFSELLHDQIKENDYLTEYMAFLGIDTAEPLQYAVFVLRIDDYDQYETVTPHEQRVLAKLTMRDFICGICARGGFFCHTLEPTPRRVAVVAGFPLGSDGQERAFVLSSDIAAYVERNYPFTVTTGVGKSVSSLYRLHDSYNQALEALDYRFVYGDNQIIVYQNVQDAAAINYINPLLYEKTLINAIKTANAGEIEAILVKIRTSICDGTRAYHIDSVRQVYCSMVNMVFAATVDLPEREGRTLHRVIDTINTTESMEAIHALTLELCIGISAGYERKRSAKAKKIVEDVFQYLQENYNRDISLTDLSNTILYTPAYINKILRADTQKTFYDLLTDIRIGKAKELLAAGLQIGEVSEQIGYTNVQSFIRMFKKEVGVTPGKFREEQRKE